MLEHSHSLLPWIDDWLSCSDSVSSADAIFVLAGQESRKYYGLELFSLGLTPRILFSVSRFEIRRFSKMSLPTHVDLLKLASNVPPPKRHFFVLFEGGSARVQYVRPRRLGTLTEIKSLARWLDENPEIRSLLIISSRTHLRRLRICCRSLLRDNIKIRLVASPDSSSLTSEERQSTIQLTRASLVELLKVLLYWPLLALRRHRRPPYQA